MSRHVGGVMSGAIGVLLASFNMNATTVSHSQEATPDASRGLRTATSDSSLIDGSGTANGQAYSCDWYDPVQESQKTDFCHSTDVRFFSRDIFMFKQRARYCALKHGVTCVLSHEVEAPFFGYYYVDSHSGERVVVSPILQSTSSATSSVLHSVPNSPNSPNAPNAPNPPNVPNVPNLQPKRFLSLAKNVVVEHTTESSLEILNRNVTGMEAFCVQLLVASVKCLD